MGTEVLYPQDFLRSSRSPVFLSSSPSSLVSRRKPQKAHSYSNPKTRSNLVGSPNPNPNPNPNPYPNLNPKPNSRYGRKAAEGGKKKGKENGGLVMGDVVILKRGESLDDKTSKSLSKEKNGVSDSGHDGILSSAGCGDLIVFSTDRLGPDPTLVPKHLRLAGVYAGSVCAASPSPSDLPLPTFSMRKETCAAAAAKSAAAIDMSATKDLCRLLGLA